MHLGPTRDTRFAVWGMRFAMFSVPLMVVGTAAHRLGLAEGYSGPAVLAVACATAVLGLLLCAIGLLRIWHEGLGGARRALIGLLWGVGVLLVPAVHAYPAIQSPAIHEVVTDPTDAPSYEALAEARRRVPTTWAAPEERRAELQSEHYPAVVPLRVEGPPTEIYDLALQIALAKGWQIVAQAPPREVRAAPAAPPAAAPQQRAPLRPGQRAPLRPGQRAPTPAPATARPAPQPGPIQRIEPGRIEAVARTRFFGFRDDVVIRIAGTPTETRIDMRSASRIGWNDLGTNARRVVDYLTEVRDRAAER